MTRAARLQEITAALTRATTPAEVAELVTGQGSRLFGATASLLYVVDGAHLRLASVTGVTDDRLTRWRNLPLDADELLPTAVRTREPAWLGTRSEVIEAWPALANVAMDGVPLQAVVALPLVVRGAVVGGLAFSFYSPVTLDEVQRDFFLTVAELCGHVLDRARSLDAERRAHEALRRHQERLALLARAGDSLAATLDARQAVAELARICVPTLADWCAIDEVDLDGQLRRLAVQHSDPAKVALAHDLAARYPSDPTSDIGVHAVIRTGRTQYAQEIPDEVLVASAVDEEHLELIRALGLHSYAVVPIRARGVTFGALTLVGEGSRRISEEDLRVAEELARRAAMMLENARLFASAEAARDAALMHADTLATVNELGRTISAELDRQKVVQAVTDAVTRLTHAEFGAFFYDVIDESGGRYKLYTVSGVPREAFEAFPMPRNTAVFAPTFAGREVVRVADITLDPRYGRRPPHHGMPPGHVPVRSYLAVPVVSRSGEVLGGLFLGHSSPGVFDERAETLTVALAAQAAVAVDNARLYGEAQRLIRVLEQANKELDQFAYATSHDLKAPLRGIASLAEWIEEDLGTAVTVDVRRKMDLLRGRVSRMDGLIAGILAFSRAGRSGGERADVDVAGVLGDVMDLLSPAPPATILVGPAMPTLWTERVALQQVLLNLVGNGLKHARRADAVVRVDARSAGEWWEFRVSDNGPGIPAQYHDRVWGIFQTLAARDQVESTGIGLAIVKKIVEGRGGRVWIEPHDGRGAVFGFTWPRRDERSVR